MINIPLLIILPGINKSFSLFNGQTRHSPSLRLTSLIGLSGGAVVVNEKKSGNQFLDRR